MKIKRFFFTSICSDGMLFFKLMIYRKFDISKIEKLYLEIKNC